MRILSIKGRNINSLRGDWEVDLSKAPLSDSVFAMIGEMGSGKSTILDSITLALYNEVPRLDKISKDTIERKGYILSKNERECFVEVRYSCSKGEFTSRWSISTARTGNLRDYEMQVFDKDGTPLTDKKSEVPPKNTELIGLSYDQFVSAILLSQGQFAKFLNADRKTRALLLEEITGMKQFSALGRKAYAVYTEKRGEIHDQQTAINSFRNVLKSDEDEAGMRLELGLMDRLQQEQQDGKAELEAKLERKKALARAREQADAFAGQLRDAQVKVADFEQRHRTSMDDYARLLPHKKALQDARQLAASRDDASRSEERSLRLISGLEEELEVHLEQAKRLVKRSVSVDEALGALAEFQALVSGLSQQERQSGLELPQIAARVRGWMDRPGLKEITPRFVDRQENGTLLQRLRELDEQVEAEQGKTLAQLGVGPEGLLALQVRLKQDEEHLTELLMVVSNYIKTGNDQESDKANLEKALAERSDAENALDRSSIQLAKVQADLKQAESSVQAMLTTQKLEEHRSRLVEGEACPLCGSTVHPYVHSYVVELSVVEQAHVLAKSVYDDVQKAYRSHESRLTLAKAQVTQLSDRLSIRDRELAEGLRTINDLKEKLRLEKVGKVDAVRSQLAQLKSDLDLVNRCMEHERSGRQALQQVQMELRAYDEKLQEHAALQKELTSLYNGENIVADCTNVRNGLQKAMQGLSEEKGRLQSARDRLAEARNRYSELETGLAPALMDLGFASLPEADSALLPEQEYLRLKEQQGQLIQAKLDAERQCAEVQDILDGLNTTDDPARDLSMLEQAQRELLAAMETTEGQARELRGALFAQEQNRGEIMRIEGEMKVKLAAIRPWELLNDLIGDKFGNKFNTYAQDLTLKHLLVFANKRLSLLHSRYHLDTAEKGEDENDLLVVDTFMGDERRTVKTLSGGETFMVSLALALGLSDLASRNIRIDSLFIDEGFGSLDGAALEDAMITLDKLRSESDKSIGIITHVESLKERFSVQVQLQKQANGYSTMRIVPETK